MELVDRLLAILTGPDRSTATRQLMAAGYTEDEVRKPSASGWRQPARAATTW
jgi:hypothetical protein